MRLTLRQLQIFVAVAGDGQYAGRSACGSAVAVGGQRRPERTGRRADDALFDRVGKRLILNDNGRLLLPQAARCWMRRRRSNSQFGAADSADGIGLRIGASTTIGTYVLPTLLAALRSGGGTGRPARRDRQ